MNDNVQIISFEYEVDKKSVKEAEKANDKLEKSFDDIGSSAQSVEKEIDDAQASLVRMIKANKDVAAGAGKTSKFLKGQAAEIKKVGTEAETAAQKFERLEKAESLSRAKVGGFGNLASGGGALATGVSDIGAGSALETAALPIRGAVEGIEGLVQVVAAVPLVTSVASAAYTTTATALTATSVSAFGLTTSLAVLAAPIVAIVAVSALAAKSFSDDVKTFNTAIEARQVGLRLEVEALGQTTEEIEGQIGALEEQQRQNQELVAIYTETKEAAGLLGTVFLKTGKRLKEVEAEAGTTNEELAGLRSALESSEVAANDAAEATIRATEAEKELTKTRISAAAEEAKFETRIEKANEDALEAELAAIETRRTEIEKETDSIKEAQLAAELNGTSTREYADRLKELDEELIQLAENEQFVNEQTRSTTESMEDLEKALEDAEKAEESLTKSVEKNEQKIVDETQRGADRRDSINVKALQRHEDLIVKFAQSEVDALTKIRQSQQDALRELGREDVDALRDQKITERQAQIDFQRDETDIAIKHRDNLKRINRQGKEDETTALRKLDFAAAAEARRATTRQVSEENTSFSNERKERLREFQQSQVDSRNNFILEREQRLIEFNRGLQDIQINARREAQQRRVNLARRENEIVLARNRELKLGQEASQKRLEQYAALLNAELALLAEATRAVDKARTGVDKGSGEGTVTPSPPSGGGGGATVPPPTALAAGGPLAAGQTALVNEPPFGTESFTSGGRTRQLPDTPGMFTALRSGTVNAAPRGNLTMQFDFAGVQVNTISQLRQIARREASNAVDQFAREISR